MRPGLLIVAMVLLTRALYANGDTPFYINVEKPRGGGKITIQVLNSGAKEVHLWQSQDNSWGWSNWRFEFFHQNELTVYVRKPDTTFELNEPRPLAVPANGSVEQTFFLDDGTWIAHRIPVYPANPAPGTPYVNGWLAMLSIPDSPEARKKDVWTGTITSAFLDMPLTVETPDVPVASKASTDYFADRDTQQLLESTKVDVRWQSLDVAACLQDLEAQCQQADPQRQGVKFRLEIPGGTGDAGSKITREVSVISNSTTIVDVLRYLAVQSNTQYVVRKGEVILLPLDVKIDSTNGTWAK